MTTIGPREATLTVHTGREGLAARAGHDLEIVVQEWSATLTDTDPPVFELTADAGSLHPAEGHGGAKPLTDGDRKKIRKNIINDVLGSGQITFRSSGAGTGELTLKGTTRAVPFSLSLDGGAIAGEARFSQTDFGIVPYTGLFGALKVADEVRITVAGTLPDQ